MFVKNTKERKIKMKQVFNEYQLAWNSLYIDIKYRIREIDETERINQHIDDYLYEERETLQNILKRMLDETKEMEK